MDIDTSESAEAEFSAASGIEVRGSAKLAGSGEGVVVTGADFESGQIEKALDVVWNEIPQEGSRLKWEYWYRHRELYHVCSDNEK